MNTDTYIPDLDNDDLTYKFTKAGSAGYGRNVYNIERSINGDYFRTIGTVTKIRNSTWTSSAHWTAKSIDGTLSASGTTREEATSALEERFQPEWAERKRIEYQAKQRAQFAARDAATVEAAKRVEVLDRTDWSKPHVLVSVDHNIVVATFNVTELFPASAARSSAEALASTLRANIVNAAINAVEESK